MRVDASPTARVLMLALSLATFCARAMDISGTISSPLIITENSRLVGNVFCAVSGPATCIQFGSDNISLKLNGFTISGTLQNNPLNPTTGLNTGGQSNISIEGPGSVRLFNNGITIGGANNKVTGVVVALNTTSGINVTGTGNLLEDNTLAQNTGDADPPNGTQLAILGNGNQFRRNEIDNNGVGPNIIINADGNVLEENNSSATAFNFLFYGDITILSGHSGNILRRNSLLGDGGAHVRDLNPAGANTYENNLCVSQSFAPPWICPNIPAFSGHLNATAGPLSSSQQISNLVAQLNSFNLGPSGQSLLNKLLDIQDKITKAQLKPACNDLAAFINEVTAQSGKLLTAAQTSQLIAGANQLRTTLGC